jgi:hypothetical protein
VSVSQKLAITTIRVFNSLTNSYQVAQCEAFHSVKLNCTIVNATAEIPYTVVGGILHGEFEPNPDVAGVGVSCTRPIFQIPHS